MSSFDYLADPFKRRTDKVALVGMAKTSRHLSPWDDDEFEIWIINEMPNTKHNQYAWIKRFDRSFQMHPKWDYARGNNFNDMDHYKFLTNEGGNWRRTDFPIYMLEHDESIPGSIVYPFEDIINSFAPNEENVKYFTCSFGYMMAIAIWMGYKEIAPYGFCMTSETEYAMQKPCGEFWMGVCVGRGIKLTLPKGSPMLGQTVKLYGYDKIPGLTLMHLEIKRNMLRKNYNELRTKLERLQGEQQRIDKETKVDGIGKGRKKKLREQFNENHQKEVQLLCQVNAFHGALQAQIENINDLKYLPTTEDIKVVMPVPAK